MRRKRVVLAMDVHRRAGRSMYGWPMPEPAADRNSGSAGPAASTPGEPLEGVIAGVIAGAISGVSTASVGWMWLVRDSRRRVVALRSALLGRLRAPNVTRMCDVRHVRIDIRRVSIGGYSGPRRLRIVLRAALTGGLEGYELGFAGSRLLAWWECRAPWSSEPTGAAA
jgi:hypothetical protein